MEGRKNIKVRRVGVSPGREESKSGVNPARNSAVVDERTEQAMKNMKTTNSSNFSSEICKAASLPCLNPSLSNRGFPSTRSGDEEDKARRDEHGSNHPQCKKLHTALSVIFCPLKKSEDTIWWLLSKNLNSIGLFGRRALSGGHARSCRYEPAT